MSRRIWCAWAGFAAALAFVVPALSAEANSPSQDMLDAMVNSTAAYKDYMHSCAGCHRFDGNGVTAKGVPNFNNSVGLLTHSRKGREYMIRVPGSAQAQMNNAELAAVLNWVVATYSPEQLEPDFKPFTSSEVGAVRRYRFDNVTVERHKLELELAEKGHTLSPYLFGKN